MSNIFKGQGNAFLVFPDTFQNGNANIYVIHDVEKATPKRHPNAYFIAQRNIVLMK